MPQPASQTTAFVTGATSGIGAAIALALARKGYDVAVSARSTDTLGNTLAAITSCGRRALAVPLDLSSATSPPAAMGTVISTFGHLDVLVNNASAAFFRSAATELSLAQFNEVMAINVTGTFSMCQLMARHLIESRRNGRIVNMASTHGVVGAAEVAAYGISKAAIIHMTKMLAIEWAPSGINVNAIAPGAVETPSRPGLRDPQRRQSILSRIPVGRLCTMEDVAQAACYLASPAADYMTGQTLLLDGGLTCA